jgi:hypothetical protein
MIYWLRISCVAWLASATDQAKPQELPGRGDDIAVAVAEGHDLIAFVRHCRCDPFVAPNLTEAAALARAQPGLRRLPFMSGLQTGADA